MSLPSDPGRRSMKTPAGATQGPTGTALRAFTQEITGSNPVGGIHKEPVNPALLTVHPRTISSAARPGNGRGQRLVKDRFPGPGSAVRCLCDSAAVHAAVPECDRAVDFIVSSHAGGARHEKPGSHSRGRSRGDGECETGPLARYWLASRRREITFGRLMCRCCATVNDVNERAF